MSRKKQGAKEEKFWSYIQDKMFDIYGLNPPPEIIERLEVERAQFEGCERLMSALLFCGMLRETVEAAGGEMIYKGSTNNLFIGWLTGATRVNPLRPHYYCKECKRVEFVSKVNDGWDLKKKKCKCGAYLTGDGHWLAPPMVHRVNYMEIDLPLSFKERVGKLLENYYATQDSLGVVRCFFENEDKNKVIPVAYALVKWEEGGEINTEPFYKFIFGGPVDQIQKLSNITEKTPTIEEYLSEDVLHSFRDKKGFRMRSSVGNTIDLTSGDHFSDILRAYGLDAATFYDFEPSDIREMPAFRDDIYNFLQIKMQETGVGGVAYATRACEMFGRGMVRYNENWLMVESLRSMGIDDKYIDNLEKIEYLFPRGHSVGILRRDLILAWYRLHYPDEFEEVFRIKEEDESNNDSDD